MITLTFPDDFLWGTATAAHQVEGDNSNSDWWDFETKAGTICAEPSGIACDHYNRYREDIKLLADLGFNTYRFSVEWARIEPSEGTFDSQQLAHYRDMIDACREDGLEPMVTLNHFTLPKWLGRHGGWLSPKSPALFERYVRRVVAEIGDGVGWWCTLNEPNVVASGGYLGKWGFPPNRTNWQDFVRVRRALIAAHRRAVPAIKELQPDSRAGLTLAMNEGDGNEGGRAIIEYQERLYEVPYLEACENDDYIGVQTYTRSVVNAHPIVAPIARFVARYPQLERQVVPTILSRMSIRAEDFVPEESRTTQMGWEYRPQAVAATVRRVASRYPDKLIVVTEHGVATSNDEDRVNFIQVGLEELHKCLEDGIKIGGYIHWSAMDNFEWARGYEPTFGLIGIDRKTLERQVRPSARFLGEIAKTGRIEVPGTEASELVAAGV